MIKNLKNTYKRSKNLKKNSKFSDDLIYLFVYFNID